MNRGLKVVEVFIHGQKAGRLGQTADGTYVFEYTAEFLETGFSISPIQLPLRQGVFAAKAVPFYGMFGVFADSLPDGWGRLLIDRYLLKKSIDPGSLTQADRLSLVGSHGMGALEYRPESAEMGKDTKTGIKMVADEVKKILMENYTGNIEMLAKKGGSSGGARPKAFIEIKGEPWMVKFPNSGDRNDAGVMEYEYSLAAKKCGIEMAETALLEKVYFGVKRFDRKGKKKIHMHSTAGLLNSDFRIPSLDYLDIMRLAESLTKDIGEIKNIFRLMVFNILCHNRDDHAKNFSFLYENGRWRFSPAYDLTYSGGFNGQHTTTLLGKGLPEKKDIMECARLAGIKRAEADRIYGEVHDATGSLRRRFK
ncbi:MAG: type II toxin-antitoxin system HipA family toxin [Spirochaetia bacterium]|nr:type II toxin-antitoxin system HipA family toxin [Spirochaetia bacterium]